jgi:hypothetical protein
LSHKVIDSLPAVIERALRRAHFLFLGYSLTDWNIRALLNQVTELQVQQRHRWSIQKAPEDLDARFWKSRRVDVYSADLAEFVKELCVQTGIAIEPDPS